MVAGRVYIVITGFSGFAGVVDNPTEFIAKNLPAYLAERGRALPAGAEIIVCEVLCVSGKAVVVFLSKTAQKLAGLPLGSEVLLVHFGVDVNATQFQLEARAKNEASFRTADQAGWMPRAERIDAGEPLDSFLHTDLPLESIAGSLAAGPLVKISGDAGLFVCNYTYYNSLKLAHINDWHSLFVHVPPFAVIPADTQLRFAANLLDVLAATILAQITGPSRMMQPSTLVTAVA